MIGISHRKVDEVWEKTVANLPKLWLEIRSVLRGEDSAELKKALPYINLLGDHLISWAALAAVTQKGHDIQAAAYHLRLAKPWPETASGLADRI